MLVGWNFNPSIHLPGKISGRITKSQADSQWRQEICPFMAGIRFSKELVAETKGLTLMFCYASCKNVLRKSNLF